MKIIWVYENISRNKSAYSKFNILSLLASASLWKRNHPYDNTVLYCDDITYDLLKRKEVLSVWDEVILIDFNLPIDKNTFWASSKLHVLSLQNEPVIIMDGDTLVFKKFDHHLLPDRILVSNLEEGRGYYPTALDPLIRNLSYKARWKTKAVNVSFLYLPDPSFTKEYANLSLQFMKEFTEMKVPNSKYLIFAEQLLLRHLMDEYKLNYKPIISNAWDCNAWKWDDKDHNGLWSFKDSWEHFIHYGPLKEWYKKDDPAHPYQQEIDMLRNCINFHKFIDLSDIERP